MSVVIIVHYHGECNVSWKHSQEWIQSPTFKYNNENMLENDRLWEGSSDHLW
jgi:hypothetical protein